MLESFRSREPKNVWFPLSRHDVRRVHKTQHTSCLESGNQTFLGSGGRNDSNTHHFARIGEKKTSWTRSTWCQESMNKKFLGSGGRNDSNTHQLARISQKKIFYELDVHHVWKVGIKRFWAHETEMTLTHISSLESVRKNIFMNSTYIMSRKWE